MKDNMIDDANFFYEKDESKGESAVRLSDGLDPLFPTREEIEKLAYNNLILYAAMTAKETHGLTWTETLQFAVKHIIEKNNELQEQMIKMAKLSTKPLIIEKRV